MISVVPPSPGAILKAAFDCAVEYTMQRKAFGSPISKLQAIQMKIADMQIRLETARQLTLRAAILKDAALPYTKVSLHPSTSEGLCPSRKTFMKLSGESKLPTKAVWRKVKGLG